MPINVMPNDALHGYSRETPSRLTLTQISVTVQHVTTSYQIPICSPLLIW